jgi:Arm domain-containing DNA-binding protein/integrase-like protein
VAKLTKRTIDAQKPGDRDVFLRDDELPGFGLRVYPSGAKVYLLQWKRDGRSRRLNLGRHGPVTCDEARRAALAALAEVQRGMDPAERRDDHKRDLTVAAMLDLYLDEGAGHLKPGSREAYRSVFRRHVVPLLGDRKLRTVSAADITKLLDDVANGRTAREIEGEAKPKGRVIVRGGRGIAARTREYLGSAFSWAVRRGLVEATPCAGVRKPKTRQVERYLNADEFARLGAALARAEVDGRTPTLSPRYAC